MIKHLLYATITPLFIVVYLVVRNSSFLTYALETDTPIASSSQQITQSEIDRIKTVVKEKLSDPESEPIATPSALPSPRLSGFSGLVIDIKADILLFDSSKGSYQISTTPTTAIVKSGQSIKRDQLAINDKIILIGTLLENDIVNAKRIVVVSANTPTSKKFTSIATVSLINTKSKSITLSIKDQTMVVNLSKNAGLTLEELQPGQKLISIIKTDLKEKTSTLLKAKLL